MTCHLIIGVGVILLAVGTQSQLPCDLRGSSSDSALFLTVQEASILDLTIAKQAGGAALDKYRDRLEIVGNLNQNIQLSLGDTFVTPMNCASVFEIVAGTSPELFYLQLKGSIDRDGATASVLDDLDTYYCRITCVASGIPNRQIFLTLNIAITDINDNPPVFLDLPYGTAINELTSIGTTVFRRISANDKDGEKNKEIDFYILGGSGSELVENGGLPTFGIDFSRQGYVTVKYILDFETLYYKYNRNYFNMTILANDTGSPSISATTTLLITIEDGDDLGPMFVYDGCIIHFGLYPQCIEPELSASIVSNVIPTNNIVATYPVPTTLTNQTVPIRARDQDTLNAEIQFSIEPTPYSDRFQLSSASKLTENGIDFYQVNLLQTQNIDRRVVKDFFLIIRAQENTVNRRFTTTRIRVTVNPSNNFPPTLVSSTNQFIGYVYENSLVGTFVTNQALTDALKLTVRDPDLTTGDPPGTYERIITTSTPFTITQDGFIAVSNPVIDYERQIIYTFQIVVREIGTTVARSSTSSMTVSVLDINDNNLLFPQEAYTVTIPAGAYTPTTNFSVSQVRATDLDTCANGDVTYSIVSVTNSGATKFSMVDVSGGGNLFAVSPVSVGDEYIVIVRGTDKANPGDRTAETVVIVTVIAAGNVAPFIAANQYDVRVSEGVPRGSDIFQVEAADAEAQPLTYQITDGNLAGDFNIDGNGQITNIDFLDYETIKTYALKVEVRDNQGGTASTTINVFVTDINDNNPLFISSPYVFSVVEGLTNTFVGNVSALDADQPTTAQSTVQYLMGTPSISLFRIDANTGSMFTVGSLNYEVQKSYQLTVQARDLATDSRTTTAQVTINVVDVADYVPRFLPDRYEAKVPENQNNYFVTAVTAVDKDTVPVINYKFAVGSPSEFSISANGTIRTNTTLNYEAQTTYTLTVTTTDGEGSGISLATATVTVTVLDMNDFSPNLDVQPSAIVTLREDTQVGELLRTITATDQDQAGTDNSRVRFSITVNPPCGTNLFRINPESGELFLKAPFSSDATRPNQYYVIVEGRDHGVPPLYSTITIAVIVERN